MFDKNHANHSLKIITEGELIIDCVCEKCECAIGYIKIPGFYIFGDLFLHINVDYNLTCDEMVIKNLLE